MGKTKITFRDKEIQAICCEELAHDGGMLYKDSKWLYSVDESTMEATFRIERTNPNGGAGRGQGKKKKYNEPTRVLYQRVPVSKYLECLAAIEKVLAP
jgi:hypothetical protein